jgi:hypothetical protein
VPALRRSSAAASSGVRAELDRRGLREPGHRRPPALAVVGVHERGPQVVVDGSAGQRLAVRAAVHGVGAAVGADPERVEVVVHRLDHARERRVGLGQLGAHPPALGHVGDDPADLAGRARATERLVSALPAAA